MHVYTNVCRVYSHFFIKACRMCFATHWRICHSLEKTLTLGKIEGRRKMGWQRIRWLEGITNLMEMSLSKLGELVMDRESSVLQSMGLQRVGHDWVTELNRTCPQNCPAVSPWEGRGHCISSFAACGCRFKAVVLNLDCILESSGELSKSSDARSHPQRLWFNWCIEGAEYWEF